MKAISAVVIRFGRIGDSVLLQPLLHRLHRRFGLPCVLLARGTWPTALYGSHADVARVLQIRHAHRPLALSPERWRAIAALRRLRAAPFYICEPEPRALGKIRSMLALARVSEQHCLFLSDMPTAADEHWIDRLLRFGEGLPTAFRDSAYGDFGNALATVPRLQLDATDRVDRAAWLRERGLSDRMLVLLQPANKRTMRWNGVRGARDDKWWPTERWVSLARSIRASAADSDVLLCGAPTEAAYLHDIRRACADARIHVVADGLPLRRLMALLEIAHSMVSVDTGPAHLAAALGCPLVVLFGQVAPAQWRPRGGPGHAVHALGGPTSGGRVDVLGVDEVFGAWAALPPRSIRAPD
jgi:ADP-heptose:LPS heptosyltransferase